MSGRRVTSIDVRCPSCGAAPGSRCQHLGSSRSAAPHATRTEVAKRADRIANPQHVDGQLALFPKAEVRR